MIEKKVQNDYAFIRRRYGVKASEIINAAPLLFVLLAEGSLAWRREKLDEVEEVLDHAEKAGNAARHLAIETDNAWQHVRLEKFSIEGSDLFGHHLGSRQLSAPPRHSNPFTNYVRRLVNALDKRDVVHVESDSLGSMPFPEYEICRTDLTEIAGGDEDAIAALAHGHARLAKLPKALLEDNDDALAKRIEWLKEKLPDDWGNPSPDGLKAAIEEQNEKFAVRAQVDDSL